MGGFACEKINGFDGLQFYAEQWGIRCESRLICQ
jgi:hypothetical protein